MLDYLWHILIVINIYALLTMGLSVVLGHTGLPCFAVPGLFGIGAYASAFITAAGVPFGLALVLSAATAGLCAFLMSYPALQMRGDYFAIVTLGFSEIVRLVLLNENARYSAAGDVGIIGVVRPSLFGFTVRTLPAYFVLSGVLMLACYIGFTRLARSPYGRVLRAIRDDEDVADAFGKDTRVFKVQVLVVLGVASGVAGSLWAHYIQFVHPTQFTTDLLVFLLASVVLFQPANITGAIFGAAFMIGFPEAMRFFGLPQAFIGAMRLMILGTTIVVIILLRERSSDRVGRSRVNPA